MKFKKFINETSVTDNKKLAQALYIILEECQPYLKDTKGLSFLYSGRESKDFGFSRKVRQDRLPKDMDPYMHEFLDKKFNEKFGFKARSNSLFVTGSDMVARNYGKNSYFIFPMGSYKFIYNKKVKDLYAKVGDVTNLFIFTKLVNAEVKEKKVEWYAEGMEKFTDDPKISRETKATNYANIEAIKYYKDRMNDGIIQWKLDTMGEWLDKNLKYYSNHNIVDAINSKCEIMLNCEKYYGLIEYSNDRYLVEKYFKMEGIGKQSESYIQEWIEKNEF